MPRPSKPIQLVKSHISKDQKESRAAAESELLTGHKMLEWPSVKRDPEAHKFFLRVARLFGAIGKNDALLEGSINRYCQILSEVMKAEKEKFHLQSLIDELTDRKKEMEFLDFMHAMTKLISYMNANERTLKDKRKMLLDIEKESGMTLASQLRSIPKKQIESDDDPMAEFFKRRASESNQGGEGYAK